MFSRFARVESVVKELADSSDPAFWKLLRVEEESAQYARYVPDDKIPGVLVVHIIPCLDFCSHVKASGCYARDAAAPKESPRWLARHHGYTITLDRKYNVWKLLAASGCCLAETKPRMDLSLRHGNALPHAPDMVWKAAGTAVAEDGSPMPLFSMEVNGEREEDAGEQAALAKRLMLWGKASGRFRGCFMRSAPPRADVTEMVSRVHAALRANARRGTSKKETVFGRLRWLLRQTKCIQRWWRACRAARAARLTELLEAWTAADEASVGRMRVKERKLLSARHPRRLGEVQEKLAKLESITGMERRAALVAVYLARDGGVPFWGLGTRPVLDASRKKLDILKEVWWQQRMQADTPASPPPAERWALSLADWIPPPPPVVAAPHGDTAPSLRRITSNKVRGTLSMRSISFARRATSMRQRPQSVTQLSTKAGSRTPVLPCRSTAETPTPHRLSQSPSVTFASVPFAQCTGGDESDSGDETEADDLLPLGLPALSFNTHNSLHTPRSPSIPPPSDAESVFSSTFRRGRFRHQSCDSDRTRQASDLNDSSQSLGSLGHTMPSVANSSVASPTWTPSSPPKASDKLCTRHRMFSQNPPITSDLESSSQSLEELGQTLPLVKVSMVTSPAWSPSSPPRASDTLATRRRMFSQITPLVSRVPRPVPRRHKSHGVSASP